jgi:hypothetical protein
MYILDDRINNGEEVFGYQRELLYSNLRKPFDTMNDLSKAQSELYKEFKALKKTDAKKAWKLYNSRIYKIHKEWCRVYDNEYIPALESVKNYASELGFDFDLDETIQELWYPGDEKYLQEHDSLLPRIYENYSGLVKYVDGCKKSYSNNPKPITIADFAAKAIAKVAKNKSNVAKN